MTNCVDQDAQHLECGRRGRFLDHHTSSQLEHDQANAYFSMQRHNDPNLPLVQMAVPQEPALGKHYTLFPEAAGFLNQTGDQYSCLTHEMVDFTGQAYESPEDVLFLRSGRAGRTTVSTGSTRLSLHPAATVSERGGASGVAQQRRKTAAEGKIMKEIADDLTLTLCTSARQITHLSTEPDRVPMSIV